MRLNPGYLLKSLFTQFEEIFCEIVKGTKVQIQLQTNFWHFLKIIGPIVHTDGGGRPVPGSLQ